MKGNSISDGLALRQDSIGYGDQELQYKPRKLQSIHLLSNTHIMVQSCMTLASIYKKTIFWNNMPPQLVMSFKALSWIQHYIHHIHLYFCNETALLFLFFMTWNFFSAPKLLCTQSNNHMIHHEMKSGKSFWINGTINSILFPWQHRL